MTIHPQAGPEFYSSPVFRKNIVTDDGKIIYGVFNVDGEYHPEIQEFSFRIYATLYPNEQKFTRLITALRIADPEDGLPL